MRAVADHLIDAVCKHFSGQQPHRSVRLPDPAKPGAVLPVDAIFTTDGTRPRWDNLSVVVHEVRPEGDDSIELWRSRFAELPLRAALLVANENRSLLLRVGDSDMVELHPLPSNDRFESELAKYAARFAPRGVARHRRGQLSFADLETTLSPQSLGFVFRHRTRLHEALHAAIHDAIEKVPPQRRKAFGKKVIDLALAYLAARVLEDKGFLAGPRESVALINSPRKLLRLTQEKTNGFFRSAYRDILPSLEDVPDLLEALAAHLGSATTFALVSHHDVGLLYEWLLEELRSGAFDAGNDTKPNGSPKLAELPSQLAELQQHYTPIALTERILEHLPLERIRPEHRYIFDPTAGSGSFLLAATQRLAGMSDLDENRRDYLASHVVGNDIDPFAKDITFLRYCLVQQSELGEDVFPRPNSFTKERYEDLARETMGFQPGVVVANPPYSQKEGVQEAAVFVGKMLDWLNDGAQFGLVLPSSFLTQTARGVMDARTRLSAQCRILEVWQLPERAVGLAASQAVCIVLGIIGGAKATGSIARAVFPKGQATAVREEGLLGVSWIAQVQGIDGGWRTAISPSWVPDKGALRLTDLFHVFTGPTPAPREKLTAEPIGESAHPYFRLAWLGDDRIWADPQCRPSEAWINAWKRPAKRNVKSLMGSKLIVHNSTNRNAENPLKFCYDTNGYWPDHNAHCIVARENAISTIPLGWNRLSVQQRLLWLAGIFASNLGRQIFTTLRGSRHSSISTLKEFPLPAAVDSQLVDLMSQILEAEQEENDAWIQESATPLQGQRRALEQLVEQSYGHPDIVQIARTSPDPVVEQLRAARREKSIAVVGQVVDVEASGGIRILLYLQGTRDESQEAWVPLPYELPGWALDGTSFVAKMSRRIKTFADLAADRAALRDFRHPPRAYEEINVIAKRLLSSERK